MKQLETEFQSTGGLERSARLGLPLKKMMINGKNQLSVNNSLLYRTYEDALEDTMNIENSLYDSIYKKQNLGSLTNALAIHPTVSTVGVSGGWRSWLHPIRVHEQKLLSACQTNQKATESTHQSSFEIREFLTGTLQAEVKLKTTPKDKTFSVVFCFTLKLIE